MDNRVKFSLALAFCLLVSCFFLPAAPTNIPTPGTTGVVQGGDATLQTVTATNVTIKSFQIATNAFVGTVLDLKTNDYVIVTGTSFGVTGLADVPTSTSGYAVLHIIATSDITFTNALNLNCSDFQTTRTLTNGTQFDYMVNAQNGFYTNSYLVRTPHN